MTKTISPTLAEIRATATRIAPYVVHTPTLPYYGESLHELLPANTRVSLKLELLQRTGSFKARGALNVALNLTDEQKCHGITAFSAGNHAIAASYAARALGLSAKVVMPKTANPFRVERCNMLGAEVVFAEGLEGLVAAVEKLQRDEGRAMIHPFEGPHTVSGTGMVGLEFMADVASPLDAVIVPIGGGGLIAGIASAVKQINPECMVYGVEPVKAQGMSQSLREGAPAAKVEVNSIADSLSAPFHTPGNFAIIQKYVDEVVTVEDGELIEAMRLIFGDLKLAVEPAGAAAMAALLGPLRDKCAGKHVGLVFCGSNIDRETFNRLVA